MPSPTSCGGDEQVRPQQRAVVPQRGGDLARGREDEVVDAAEVGVELPAADERRDEQQRHHPRSASSARSRTASTSASERGRGDRQLRHHAPGARRQHDHAVAEAGRLLDVVGDEQDRARLLAQRLREPVLHLAARERVERGEGLVQAQDRLAREQGAQEGHALAHAARELVGAGALEALQAEGGEERVRAGARLLARRPGQAHRERGVVDRAQPRQQAVALGHEHGRVGADACRRRAPAGRTRARAASSCRSRSGRRRRRSRRRRTSRSTPSSARTVPKARLTPARLAVPPPSTFRGSCAGASSFVVIAPSAGITPQVRRVSAGSTGAISAGLRQPPCWSSLMLARPPAKCAAWPRRAPQICTGPRSTARRWEDRGARSIKGKGEGQTMARPPARAAGADRLAPLRAVSAHGGDDAGHADAGRDRRQLVRRTSTIPSRRAAATGSGWTPSSSARSAAGIASAWSPATSSTATARSRGCCRTARAGGTSTTRARRAPASASGARA